MTACLDGTVACGFPTPTVFFPFYFIISFVSRSAHQTQLLAFFFLSRFLSTHQTQNLLPHLSLRSLINPQRAKVESAKIHPSSTAGREIEPSSTPPSFSVQGNPLAAAGRSLVARAPLLGTLIPSFSWCISGHPLGDLESQASNPLDPFHRCRNGSSYGAIIGKEEFTLIFWDSPFAGLPFHELLEGHCISSVATSLIHAGIGAGNLAFAFFTAGISECLGSQILST
ncbi:hypothetical protein Pyn_11601 [Prunus yedoensis var. nudiflora]|uniref:Uncharacterized protein n=1 Tax=Prunus yedoensis var. nudiflora TaxID=2094558 RepID=A0A314UMD0_PRUYE|nr:hypothetical protein Pyn_11601 [Prunus yedoensis var. nudiflora]